MAMINSLTSLGVEEPADSMGVPGIEDIEADIGAGLDGSLVGGAIGRVSESLLAFLVAGDVDRDSCGEVWPGACCGGGGGGIAAASVPFAPET